MPNSRRIVLNDDEIGLGLLDISDIEDVGDEQDGDYEPEMSNSNEYSEEEISDSDMDPEYDIPTPRTSRGRVARHRGGHQRGRTIATSPVRNNSEWTSKPFNPIVIPFMQPAYLPVDTTSFADKFDYFKQYINDELIDLIVEKSNNCHVYKTGRSLGLSKNECYIYLGITFIMSCIQYPHLRMYWEIKYRIPQIADYLPRNRFFLLRNSIKLVFDNEISQEERSKDRLWKVRPILRAVTNGCRKQVNDKKMCVDEMMIPFTGSCGLKQHCPGKPYPTGLKAFVLANPDGIVCDLHVYQGDKTYPDYENTRFGLGEKAVLKLTEDLVPGHIVYCDRYFTSVKLTEALLERGIMCAGTIMKNRIPREARPLIKEDRVLKREGRGSCQVLVRDGEGLSITKWLDNKGVVFLSTVHANNTSDTCQRWCKTTKRYVNVNRPEVVQQYNINMGGVDLADRLLAVCPNRYRTKKWTQRFLSHMLDLSVSNSWLQYKKDELAKGVPPKKIQQLRAYKLELGETLIEHNALQPESSSDADSNDIAPKKRGRMFIVKTPSSKIRKHKSSHLPEVGESQQKCRNDGCRKKTTIKCKKCNVYLCLVRNRNCYEKFHA